MIVHDGGIGGGHNMAYVWDAKFCQWWWFSDETRALVTVRHISLSLSSPFPNPARAPNCNPNPNPSPNPQYSNPKILEEKRLKDCVMNVTQTQTCTLEVSEVQDRAEPYVLFYEALDDKFCEKVQNGSV